MTTAPNAANAKNMSIKCANSVVLQALNEIHVECSFINFILVKSFLCRSGIKNDAKCSNI